MKLNKTILKNISYLSLGQALSMVVSFIGAIYIPRLLGPDKYGKYQIVLNYIGIFSFFALNGLNKPIIRKASKNITKTKQIIESILLIKYLASGIGIFASLFTLLFMGYENVIKFYIFIFSISLFINSFNIILYLIYQIYEKMKYLAIIEFIKILIKVPTCIILLKLGYGIFSLIIVNIATILIAMLLNLYFANNILKLKFKPKIVFPKNIIGSGINFTILDVLKILSGNIDIFMLSILTTPANVGIYSLAFKILSLTKKLRSSIGKSIFPNYSKKYKNKTLSKNVLLKHFLYILVPTIIIILLVNIISKPIIKIFIGSKYLRSAKIINILIFQIAFNYLGIPLSTIIQVSNNEKYIIYSRVVMAISNIIMNIIFFKLYGIVGIAFATLAIHLLHFLILILITRFRVIPELK